jgi:hypothetical protein
MYALIAPLAFFAVLAQPAQQVPGRVMTLALPHALRAGETAWLEVKVGVIERGEEIEIQTTAGQPLGTISPFGVRSGQPAGTYTVPVPPGAIANDHLSLRLLIDQSSHAQRGPTVKEVSRVRVKIMPATR